MTTIVEVKDLRKQYNPPEGVTAVQGVSFAIKQGEIFSLLGPNGAGKSTTINMLCGLLKPDGGFAEIAGQRDPTRPSVRQSIGAAPQALAIYEAMSAEENLRFFGRLYGLSGAKLRERVDWALEFANLAGRRGDLAEEFSGGMKRRLNIACALVHDPPVLLLDEPTVGVDPQSRGQIFESVEALKAQGKAVLYTTHYMEEAERLCDRVAIIDAGKILAEGTVDKLVAEHGGPSSVVAELDKPPKKRKNLPWPVKGKTMRFESANPLADIARLSESGIGITTLKIERANLETVFLNLTGRSLRDD